MIPYERISGLQKAGFILLWILPALAKTVLAIAGAFIMVPLTLRFMPEDWRDRKWWPWGNAEEGCPQWWLDKAANMTVSKDAPWYKRFRVKTIVNFPRYWWYSVRNPANNMRYWFKDVPASRTRAAFDPVSWPPEVQMEPHQMESRGYSTLSRWSWCGWKSGYRKVTLLGGKKYKELWIGFKVGSAVPGCGFTFQNREGDYTNYK